MYLPPMTLLLNCLPLKHFERKLKHKDRKNFWESENIDKL